MRILNLFPSQTPAGIAAAYLYIRAWGGAASTLWGPAAKVVVSTETGSQTMRRGSILPLL
jgi:hypothetical protein